jgi:hypothetical protein
MRVECVPTQRVSLMLAKAFVGVACWHTTKKRGMIKHRTKKRLKPKKVA